MARVLISLGANLGNTHENLLAAASMLQSEFGPGRMRMSQVYRTPPVGGPSGQSDFLNAVASIETERTAWEVWDLVKRVEKDLGRHRQHRWEARRIDVDILLYGDSRIWTPHLKIPHPRMCMRSFVLVPAMDVAPDLIDPVTGWTVERLHQNLMNRPTRPVRIIANTTVMQEQLQTMVRDHAGTEHRWSHVELWKHPHDMQTGLSVGPDASVLTIFCVQTPDPETIQWEDFAYPWAQALGFAESSSSTPWQGPRYLLPSNDLSWTWHEILASRSAMSCPIHPAHIQ